MKHIAKAACLMLVLMALAAPLIGAARAATLPNPRDYFDDPGMCGDVAYDYDDALWEVWYFQQADGWTDGLKAWLDACDANDLTWAVGTVEGRSAYIVRGGGARAVLVPEYDGWIMLMKQYGLEMDGALVPVPTPEPTVDPASLNSGGHTEYVYEDEPCPICHTSGKCKWCQGSGETHMYGQTVPCNPDCVFCGGDGYYPQLVAHWVAD